MKNLTMSGVLDPAGGVFDDGQHVGAGAVEEVDGEEVRRQNRLRLAA